MTRVASACSSPARSPKAWPRASTRPSPIEDVRLGKFVKIVGQKYEYFCLVTDVQLDSANADVLRDPPGDPSNVDVFLRQVLSGTTTYALVKLKPELMLANLAADVEFDEADLVPRPARTIPPHFSSVSEATQRRLRTRLRPRRRQEPFPDRSADRHGRARSVWTCAASSSARTASSASPAPARAFSRG